MAALIYKCPNCDGDLTFNPLIQKFSCEYCLSKYDEDELIQPTNTTINPNHEIFGYDCPNCGADILTNSTTAATFCYYCHSPVVISSGLNDIDAPAKILPFSITKEQAVKNFIAWTNSKKYAPTGFFTEENIKFVTGVYFPFWVVDCKMTANVDCELIEAKKQYKNTNSESKYINANKCHVIRDADLHMSCYTKSALTKVNTDLVSGVFPFNKNKIVDFNMGYLSGFLAEKRNVSIEQLEKQVELDLFSNAYVITRKESLKDYYNVNRNDIKFNVKSLDWTYTLFPVWTVTYKGKNGKIYYYSMNGESGKICGELPIDNKKLFLAFLRITFSSMIVLIILITLFWGYFSVK